MDELLKVIHDFRKRKIDLTYIENNKDILKQQLIDFSKEEPSKELNPERMILIEEIMIFSLIFGLKETNGCSIIPFYSFDEEFTKDFGDFITEILPSCFLELDTYDYTILSSGVLSDKIVEESFLFKSPLFQKLFKQCYYDKNLDYFISFVEEHKNEKLYDLFADDIVNCISTYDPILAGKYVDKFYKQREFGALDGPFYETKLAALSGNTPGDEVLFTREQNIDSVLYRLQKHFKYKIYKDGKVFNVEFPREKFNFYDKLNSVEKEMLKIIKNSDKRYCDEVIEKILNIDVSDIKGLDSDYLFTKFDRQFFIANVFDDLVCADDHLIAEKEIRIIADGVISEALWTFMETIEKAHISIKEYDEIQKVFPSYVIEDFTDDIGRNGFLEELDIPLDDDPNAKA